MTKKWKHEKIISQMSLEEKALILSGASEWTTREMKRLGIQALVFSDGPNGVRRQRGKEDHLGLNVSVPATCFPTLSALACSWDELLLYEVGQALGAEARTLGVDVLLGPAMFPSTSLYRQSAKSGFLWTPWSNVWRICWG